MTVLTAAEADGHTAPGGVAADKYPGVLCGCVDMRDQIGQVIFELTNVIDVASALGFRTVPTKVGRVHVCSVALTQILGESMQIGAVTRRTVNQDEVCVADGAVAAK